MSNGQTSESKKRTADTDNLNGEEKKAKIQEKVPGGTLLFSGLHDYQKRNDKPVPPNYLTYSPHQFDSLKDIRITKVSSFPASFHFFALSDESKVYACGFNQNGQLGTGNTSDCRNPTHVEALDDLEIVSISTGHHHSMFLSSTGSVFSCGSNKFGQCGQKKSVMTVTTPQLVQLPDKDMKIKEVACGSDFTLLLDDEGRMFSFGMPEYGQLGHGSEDKFMEKANKVEFRYKYAPCEITQFVLKECDGPDASVEKTFLTAPVIKHISCGMNHSVAIDEDGRCFTWGFGGYGRLGHNSTEDEYIPRLMKCWFRITGQADRGVVKVSCGNSFNVVETVQKQMHYMFGQTARNKEANMYPKPIDDLQGWNVKAFACGQTGWVCVADDKVIASMPSPANGMLGMGEKKKSSAAPCIIETLKGIACVGVGAGYMHTLWIARDDTPKDKYEINKFPVLKF